MSTPNQKAAPGLSAGFGMAEFKAALESIGRAAGTSAKEFAKLEGQLIEMEQSRTIYGFAAIFQLGREIACIAGYHRWSRASQRCWTCGIGRIDA